MHILKKTIIFVSIISSFGCAVAMEGSAPRTKEKVTLCHKSKKTIHVDDSAVKAHLGHGDYMGPCR
jgi:hypothetical protein